MSCYKLHHHRRLYAINNILFVYGGMVACPKHLDQDTTTVDRFQPQSLLRLLHPTSHAAAARMPRLWQPAVPPPPLLRLPEVLAYRRALPGCADIPAGHSAAILAATYNPQR